MGRRWALGLALLGCACSDYTTPGLEVEVTVRPAGEALHLRNDLGYSIELTRGYLVTSAVELVECPRLGALRQVGARMAGWMIGTARAHGLTSPTRLGAPLVEPLVGQTASLGTLRPPPDRYCQLRVTLAPADGDARGLPEEVRFVGHTFYLEGRYRSPGGSADRTLAVLSSEAIEVTVPVSDLVLDGEAPRRRRLELSRNGERWFDGLELDALPPAELARRLLASIAGSLVVSAP
jgi:hypothetical protein